MSGLYHGYKITRKWVTKTGPPQPDEFEFVHEDYDGPGDKRHGTGKSLHDCVEQIHELEDDQ